MLEDGEIELTCQLSSAYDPPSIQPINLPQFPFQLPQFLLSLEYHHQLGRWRQFIRVWVIQRWGTQERLIQFICDSHKSGGQGPNETTTAGVINQ